MADLTFPEFIEILNRANGALASSEEHATRIADHATAAEGFGSRLGELAGQPAALVERLNAAELVGALGKLEGDSGTAASGIATSASTTMAALDGAARGSTELAQRVEGFLRDSATDVETLVARAGAASKAVEEAIATFNARISAFAAKADQQLASVTGSEQTLGTALADYTTRLTGELRQQFETASSTLIDRVSKAETQALQNSFEEAQKSGADYYRIFEEESVRLAEELERRYAEMLTELRTYFCESLETRVVTGFNELIRECMEPLAKEVVDCLSQIAFGAELSAALAPILPEIVVAKKAAELINKGLDYAESG